jgi:hypothetical protein
MRNGRAAGQLSAKPDKFCLAVSGDAATLNRFVRLNVCACRVAHHREKPGDKKVSHLQRYAH